MSFQKPNEINVTPLAFELIWTAMWNNGIMMIIDRGWRSVLFHRA
jgi:hypothetical protein